MKRLLGFLWHRNFLMVLALFLGIFFGEFSSNISFLSLPVLALMMLASLSAVNFSDVFRSPMLLKDTYKSLLMNYVLHGILLMGLVYILVPYDSELFLGFLIIVFAPPGVVIMPFAALFGGNLRMASAGVVGGYLAFLLIFPLFLLFVNPTGAAFPFNEVLQILIFVIILPMLLSRPLRLPAIQPFMNRWRSRIINWSFFIIIYIVIGLNRHFFGTSIVSLLWPSLALVIFLFGSTYVITFVLKKRLYPPADVKTLELMFAVKNNGFSAVVSLQLFGAAAAIPSAALSVILLLYLIVFSFRNKN